MPSTNKLYSRIRGSIAKFLTSFCGIASFGVVTILAVAGASANASAVGNSSNSSTITANLAGSVAIRLLDSTASTEITRLDFSFDGEHAPLPTAAGVTSIKSLIVDVATSNPTGYKLYMQSNYQDSNNNYTTNLVHTDTDVADVIPTTIPTSGSPKVFWNYTNPLTNSSSSSPTPSVIPPHGTPDKLDQYFSTTNSRQTPVDINVGVDTTIVSGTYENQLLFSAVGNPDPVTYNIDFDASGGAPEPADISTTASASIYSTTIDSTAPTKAGYTFSHWSISSISPSGTTATCNNSSTCNPGDTLIVESLGESAVDVELTAIYTINQYTLTVAPNGGTWSGSTQDQTFTQDYATTKTITNPSANATYTVSYSDNSQGAECSGISGASCSGSTNINRAFTGWNLTATPSGTPSGSFDSNTGIYTYNLGDDTLTADYNSTSDTFTLPLISKDHYECKWAEGDPTGAQYDGGTTRTVTANTTYYAYCTIIQSTLTVNPNGGTWSGSTSPQNFTQDYGSTKSISNPTATPTYSITYNANGQGASYTGSPTSVNRPFSSWAISGGGSFAGGSYTFGETNGTLTAQYNTTSSSFTLPAITKTGYNCYWASNSTGTKYGDGGASKTISANLTIYAYCTVAEHTIANSTYFQEVTSCPSTLTEGTEYTLTDRGEPSKTYKAARLKDNKCWMTSDYNLSSAAGTLSSTNYNVPSGSTFSLSASSTSWGSSYDGNYVYNRSGTNGGLYSWYAATAGTNPSSDTSTYDICPKGWRLPTQAEYQTIINNYGSTGAALVASNAKLQYSGYCLSGYCPFVAGIAGRYWSSTASSSTNAYRLYFYSSNADMGYDYKYTGSSVRCVFGS